MRYRTLIVSVLFVLWLASATFAADKYELDPVHTRIGFSVRHLMINNVAGRFMDFTGSIPYDEQDITKSAVSVKIQAASVNTENKTRDDDLRSPNFFDAAKYPEITFQSSRVEKQGDGYVCVGTLTMHGVSKEIAIPFTITGKIKDPWGNTRIGLEGGVKIDRRDWGLTYSKTLDNGGLIVGNDIKIDLNVEAVKK
jgi:polyisoprenoid-binding protein YceI